MTSLQFTLLLLSKTISETLLKPGTGAGEP
jgi:hypothetical protein